jgi:Uma2 family endonuclease
MVLAVTEAKTYTADEYLALEVESETRNEYRGGEIVPMTGGTPDHNQIAVVLNALLWFALRGKNYSVFGFLIGTSTPILTQWRYRDLLNYSKDVKIQ